MRAISVYLRSAIGTTTRRLARVPRAALLTLVGVGLLAPTAIAAEIVGSARPSVERRGHTATRLKDGSILVAGGENAAGLAADIEIYAPGTRTFRTAAKVLEPRSNHTATLLFDGRVLLAGGTGSAGALGATELYSVKSGRFSYGPLLSQARSGHTATLLADGRVVLVGGNAAGSIEIFDPEKGTFSELDARLAVPRRFHAAALLQDGRILIAGGTGFDGAVLRSGEILDLAARSVSLVKNAMHGSRTGLSVRVLPDGKVQLIGGDEDSTMELFNPRGDYFSSLAHLAGNDERLAAALRSAGRGAVIGRAAAARAVPVARIDGDVSDPLAAPTLLDRSGHTVTEIPETNEAIVVGGATAGGSYQSVAVLLSSSSASVTTDKSDYAPGETVIITGSGWLPGETVDLHIQRDNNNPPDTHLTAVADPNGNIHNDEFVIQESDLGVTFVLTATGQTSGYTAQTTFTDGNLATTVTPTTVTVTAGGPGQPFVITSTLNGANGPGWGFRVNTVWTISGGVCTGSVLSAQHNVAAQGGSGVQVFNTPATAFAAAGQVSGTFSCSINEVISQVGSNPALAIAGAAILTVTVAGNSPPDITNMTVTPEPSDEGGAVSASATFTDTNTTDTHTCSVNWGDGSPVEAGTVTEAAGSGTCNVGPHTYAENGTFTIAITVSDNIGASDTETRNHVVNNVAPVINNGDLTVTPGTIDENGSVDLSGTFTDPGVQDTHQVTISWGDGSPNTVLNLGAGVLTFGPVSHTYLDDNPTATASDVYTITVTVTDDDTGTDSATASATVNNVAPVINDGDLTITPGTTIDENDSINLSGSFTDPGTQDTHTVTIAWGDGSPNTVLNLAAGVLTFGPVAHTYLDDNPTATASDVNSITVTVTDDDTGTDSASASVTVNNVAPVVATPVVTPEPSIEGDSVSVSASFTDDGTQDTHTCSINWGDGSPAQTGTVGSGACTGSHTYAENGSFTVTVTVTDDDTGAHSNSTTHVVNNAPPEIAAITVLPEPSNEGQSVNLNATFTDPGTLDTHTCSINWGDGSPVEAGTVAAGACTASHTYGDNGSYTVSVTITDDELDSDTETTLHVVNNLPPAVNTPTVVPSPSVEGQSVTASATFTDPGANDAPFTCTVNYGDGSGNQAGTVAGNTCTGPAHTYADNGTFTVTVSVTDKDGDTGSNSVSHTVNNVAPTVNTPVVVPSPSIEGQSVTASATFTDPGVNDAPFTCTVNYGDGSGNQAGTVVGNTCTGPAHTYADNGSFTVTVSVTDKDGDAGSNSVSHTVNNANPVVGAVTVAPEPSTEGSPATASASFTDAGTADTHTCSINWGDGNTTSGTVTQGAGSGSCSGTHTYADDGTFTVTITITDDDGGSGGNSVSHTVLNAPPSITTLTVTPEPSFEGTTDTVTAAFTDPGTADVHTCSINWGDGNVTSGTVTEAAGSGTCSGTHVYADNGSYTVSVTIDDGDGGSDSESTSHLVNNANPSVNTVAVTPEPSTEGNLDSLSAAFTDPGTADTHTCTINWGDGSPTEAGTVTQGSGSGTCTGTHTYGDNGNYTVTVTVTDDDGGSHSNSTLHVVNNAPPSVATPTVVPSPSDEGGSVVASATFTDAGANDAPFTCTVNYGDGSGNLPGVVAGNTCTGPSHTYADNGIFTVTVSVTDKDLDTGSNTVSHTVQNLPPVVATPTVVPEPSVEGGSVTASATFTDPGVNDAPFTCTVNYGDGSGNLPGVVAGNTCTGPAHTYVDDGSFTVTVAVTDKDGGTGSNSVSHVVDNAPPVVGAVTVTPEPSPEGASATASASFTDAGTADTHTCSINWGDGNTTSGTVTQGAGTGSCSGSHTYADNGTFTVTITIDDGDDTGSNSVLHTVTNVAPTVTAVSVTPEPSAEGSLASVSATYTDPGTADTHTCSINWGDGNVTSGSASGGTCTGSHTYGDNGSYTVTVTVTDDDGDSHSNSTTHGVTNVPPSVGTVVVAPEPSTEGGAATASATFTDPGANDAPFTCTVDYGDGSGVLAGTVSGNTCTGPSHVYADNGNYTVTITVTDKDGSTGSNTGSHAVGNANPVITSVTGPIDPIQIGNPATINATFTDPGIADTHTCSINWGDGSTTAGAVVESSGSGTCSGSHTYGAVGVYQVTVTVTDDDGGSDTEVYAEYIVIFDPNGGFVTGGGWIESPAGAYAADPTAVGRANFGFVSKYKNTKATSSTAPPEGETEFQFKAGSLNFHSTSYEWLVISGAKARYRGVGTINGVGSYQFELTAWDGQVNGGGGVDRFRIRIYGVYDNQLGAPDGADPTTALGGGSIVIHKAK